MFSSASCNENSLKSELGDFQNLNYWNNLRNQRDEPVLSLNGGVRKVVLLLLDFLHTNSIIKTFLKNALKDMQGR